MVLTAVFKWGIWCSPTPSSISLEMRNMGRRGGRIRTQATRMNSGVTIIRAIYITALKRGDSEEASTRYLIARLQPRRCKRLP